MYIVKCVSEWSIWKGNFIHKKKLRIYCYRGIIYELQFSVFDILLTLEWITATSRRYIISRLSSIWVCMNGRANVRFYLFSTRFIPRERRENCRHFCIFTVCRRTLEMILSLNVKINLIPYWFVIQFSSVHRLISPRVLLKSLTATDWRIS